MILHFITDSPFRMLSIPNPPEKQKELEESLLQNGCQKSIYVWKEKILDGYKRYFFCHDEGLDYTTQEMSFPTESKAICWVCKNKLPNYEKKSAAYYYLAGKYYNAAQVWKRESRKLSDEDKAPFTGQDLTRVAFVIGKELGLSHSSVEEYGAFARNLDKIYERSRELFEAILLGSVRISMRGTRKIAYLPEAEFRKVLKEQYHIIETKSEAGSKMRKRKKPSSVPKKEEHPLSVGIKAMPAFDPDMELRGLMFTIPAWIQLIERAENKTDMTLASGSVKKQLTDSLRKLDDQIRQILEALQ